MQCQTFQLPTFFAWYFAPCVGVVVLNLWPPWNGRGEGGDEDTTSFWAGKPRGGGGLPLTGLLVGPCEKYKGTNNTGVPVARYSVGTSVLRVLRTSEEAHSTPCRRHTHMLHDDCY